MHENITTQPHKVTSAPRCPACATCCFWWPDEDGGERELVCPDCTSYMPTEMITDRTGE